MAYVRARDDEFTSSVEYDYMTRLQRETASRSTEPGVFIFFVKEPGAKGARKDILWMGITERNADGGFPIDAQARIEFNYAGPGGKLYTGRGYAQERPEVTTLTRIEGFDLYADSYNRPNAARKAAFAAMQSANDAFQTGTPCPLIAAHIDCVCAHSEGGASCETSCSEGRTPYKAP